MHQAHDIEVVQQQAEQWLARLRADDCSATERHDFDLWLAADPVHASAYAQTQRLWSGLEVLADDGEVEQWRREARRCVEKNETMRRTRQRRVRWLAAAILLLCVLAAGSFAWLAIGNTTTTYATAQGQQRSLRLPDGSMVTLGPDSRLDVQFGRFSRTAKLRRGEGLFEIVHDGMRPFELRAGDNTVKDLGTRFDVYREGPLTVVTLVKGAVSVVGRGFAAQLAPGEQLRVDGGSWRKRNVDPKLSTSWTKGKLIFRDTPLSEVVARVNRYGSKHVVIADRSLDDLRVSGSFKAGNVDALVHALQSAFPISAEADAAQHTVYLHRTD